MPVSFMESRVAGLGKIVDEYVDCFAMTVDQTEPTTQSFWVLWSPLVIAETD